MVVNDRNTTKRILDIRPEKQDSVINPSQVHRCIFDATRGWTIPRQSSPLTTPASLIVKTSPLETNITRHFQIADHVLSLTACMYHSFLNLSTRCPSSNMVKKKTRLKISSIL